MSEIKYWIADKFFGKELDDAYELGVRYGRQIELSKFRITMNMYKPKDLTKTQSIGYDIALDVAERRRGE
jgi:hypothetical protein